MGVIDQVIDAAVEGGKISGTMILVAHKGKVVFSRTAGFADREAGTPIEDDTIYRLASVTKPIVAATALAASDAGLLDIEGPVTDYLPWFTPKISGGAEAVILVRHLLTHTSGITYRPGLLRNAEVSGGLDNTSIGLQDNIRRLANVPLVFEPGSAWEYGMSIDVLGAVIEAATGMKLADAVDKYITGPLGMNDTKFGVADKRRLAVAYADSDTRPVRMEGVHTVIDPAGAPVVFAPDRIFNPEAFQSGGAGMAGSAPDFLKLLEAIRTGGAPVLSGETVNKALQNQIGSVPRPDRPGQRFCFLGMVIEDPAAGDTPQPAGTIGWGGVYGHSWFMDPVNQISAVQFSNTALEGCNGAYPGDVMRAIYKELV